MNNDEPLDLSRRSQVPTNSTDSQTQPNSNSQSDFSSRLNAFPSILYGIFPETAQQQQQQQQDIEFQSPSNHVPPASVNSISQPLLDIISRSIVELNNFFIQRHSRVPLLQPGAPYQNPLTPIPTSPVPPSETMNPVSRQPNPIFNTSAHALPTMPRSAPPTYSSSFHDVISTVLKLTGFRCNQCNISAFQTVSELSAHTRTVHGRYRCQECRTSFLHRSYLLRHAAMHLPFGSFCCRMCRRGFYRKEFAIQHLTRAHYSANPYTQIEVILPTAKSVDFLMVSRSKYGRIVGPNESGPVMDIVSGNRNGRSSLHPPTPSPPLPPIPPLPTTPPATEM